MITAKTFSKGQIWYWTDTVFGKKDSPLGIPPVGESSIRYSRYVLIVQNTNMINSNYSVLAIPTSSTNSSKYDIPIRIPGHDRISYAKPYAIFPASPLALKHYICAIDDNAIKEIDNAVSKFLLSGFTNENVDDESLASEEINEEEIITKPESITDSYQKKTDKWTDEEKVKFVQMYYTAGIDETATKYSIKRKTAISYIYKWKAEGLNINEIKSNISNSSKEEDIHDVKFVDKVVKSASYNISTFADKMEALMRIDNTYKCLSGVRSSKTGKLFSEDQTYDILNKCIYFSLIDYMGIIRNEDGTFSVNSLYKNEEYINNCKILYIIFNDNRFDSNDRIHTLFKKYREIFGHNKGISKGWLDVFKHKLEAKIYTDKLSFELIYDYLKDYCEK